MPNSIVQITEGTGKKLQTWQRVIGANTVESEVVIAGDSYLPTYAVTFSDVDVATSAAHVVQLMAGASKPLLIRRIRLRQHNLSTGTTAFQVAIIRLSSAGTGGATLTPRQWDQSDAAVGATAMSLPSAKGTESVELERLMWSAYAAHPFHVLDMVWEPPHGSKPIIVPAGTSGGIAIKIVVGVTGASLTGSITFDERDY